MRTDDDRTDDRAADDATPLDDATPPDKDEGLQKGDPARGEDPAGDADNTAYTTADRPGGPGQTGMNPREPGRSSTAPAADAPDHDPVVEERRRRLDDA